MLKFLSGSSDFCFSSSYEHSSDLAYQNFHCKIVKILRFEQRSFNEAENIYHHRWAEKSKVFFLRRKCSHLKKHEKLILTSDLYSACLYPKLIKKFFLCFFCAGAPAQKKTEEKLVSGKIFKNT